jgi:peptide/nickel transport system substrate-binding protein
MVDGAQTSDDGKRWKLILRDGLKFHDGTPVLGRDCVASIQRWGKRDAFGQALMAATDELSAPDDKTIQFRLKQPFPLLPAALGKVGVNICPMMPERLAKIDPFTQVTEMVGQWPVPFRRQRAHHRGQGRLVTKQRLCPKDRRQTGRDRGTKNRAFRPGRMERHP